MKKVFLWFDKNPRLKNSKLKKYNYNYNRFFHETFVAFIIPTDYYDDYRGGSAESFSDGKRKQSSDRHPTAPSRPAFPNTFTFYNDDLSSYSVYDSPLDGKTTFKKTSMSNGSGNQVAC